MQTTNCKQYIYSIYIVKTDYIFPSMWQDAITQWSRKLIATTSFNNYSLNCIASAKDSKVPYETLCSGVWWLMWEKFYSSGNKELAVYVVWSSANRCTGLHEATFTWNSTSHVRCHHQSHREADVDGERLTQGVSTQDGLSDWAAAKQLTNSEEENSRCSLIIFQLA